MNEMFEASFCAVLIVANIITNDHRSIRLITFRLPKVLQEIMTLKYPKMLYQNEQFTSERIVY